MVVDVSENAGTQERLTLGEYKIKRIPEARRNNTSNTIFSDRNLLEDRNQSRTGDY